MLNEPIRLESLCPAEPTVTHSVAERKMAEIAEKPVRLGEVTSINADD